MNQLNTIIKYIYLIIFLGSVQHSSAQQNISIVDDIVTLSTVNSSNNYTVTARNSVLFKTGFSFQSQGTTFYAKVDSSLIFNENYLASETLPSTTIDTNSPVGLTNGSYAVSPSGAATYQIPIFVSPGTAGMQPSISLIYNSQGGSGLLGKGWDIYGLSVISRVPQTVFTDGQSLGVNLNSDDRFALDGNRLLLLTGTYGVQGSTYETQTMSFSKIETFSYRRDLYFKVTTKDGKEIEYGNSEDSRALASGFNIPYMYRVNKITDSHGNYMTFFYKNVSGESVIEHIEYTGNENAGLKTYNQLQFIYNQKSDQNTLYVDGASINQTLLLKRVKSICEGNVVRTYDFEYVKSNFDETHLNKINETGSDGKKLNPTVINWNLPTSKFIQTSQEYFNDKVLYSGDFNGDGRTDYFMVPKLFDRKYNSSDQWELYLTDKGGLSFTKAASGYLTDYFVGAEVADINNDGKDEIYFKLIYPVNCDRRTDCLPYDKKFQYYYFDGNTLMGAGRLYNITIPSHYNDDFQLLTADFEGDGKTGFLILENGYISEYLSNDLTPKYFYAPRGSNIAYEKVLLIDFNGDGRKDILEIGPTACDIYEFNKSLNKFEQTFTSNFLTTNQRVFLGDFNGDGKTDLLTWYDHKWSVYYSTGTSFALSPNSPNFLHIYDPDASEDDDNYVAADFNGDGKTDLLEFCRTQNNGIPLINILYSTGNNFKLERAATDVDIDWILAGKYYYDKFDDLNGDGKADIFLARGSRGMEDQILTFYPNDQSNLVSKITNGFNQSVNFTYKSLSGDGAPYYTKGADSQFPVNDIQSSLYVVSELTVPNGIGGTSSILYNYTGAKVHRQGLGFLGFNSIVAHNLNSDRKDSSSTILDQTGSNPSFRPVTQISLTKVASTGTNISGVSTTFSNSQPVSGSKAWFTYPSVIAETNYLTGVCVTTKSDYKGDINGNINGNIYSVIKDYGDGFSDTTKYENYVQAGSYMKSDGTGMPNKPQQVTVIRKHPDDTNSFKNQTQFTYDEETGDLLTKIENSDLAVEKQITTTYENYNSFGSVGTINISYLSDGGNVNTSETSTGKAYTYEPIKGRFLESVSNQLIMTTYSYDPVFGNVRKEKLSNLHDPTEYEYDSWGNLIRKTLPNHYSETTNIFWSSDMGPGKPLYYTNTTNSANSLWSKTYFDEFNRILKNETVGFNDISKYSTTTYNKKGEVETKSSFVGDSKVSQLSYSYYTDGRIQKETDDINGSSTSFTYPVGGNKIVTTADGKIYTKILDNWGNPKQIDEPSPGGTIIYKYFSHGKPSSIQSPASTISFDYDQLGNQTTLSDPDAGKIYYRYDPAGRLTYQRDANENETYLKYDDYGRLDHKEGELQSITYTYEYVPSGAGIGKIEKITASNGTYNSYTYDDYGRVETSTQYTDESNSFTYTNEYNDAGDISQVYYPGGNGGNSVVNLYDANGILTEVLFVTSDGTSTVWSLSDLNATTMTYQLGNGLTTTKQFNSNNFTLASIVTSNQVQANYYDFDPINGMLSSREDKRTGYNLKESFKYDSLYRLTNWDIFKNVAKTFSNSINYKKNGSGNIESKSGIGVYSYLSDRPHAIDILEPASGCPVSQNEQIVNYTDFGKISDIEENNYKLIFTYGPDQERVKSEMQEGGQTLYTNYYGGLYEKKQSGSSTIEYTYIPAGDGLAAVYIKKSGETGKMYYIHKDHLGSIVALTDDNGNIAEQYAYDPWGRRRNPADWSFTNVSSPTLLSRGFTGHEHIEELGLINMNGRVYDPILGLFLSPDNYVQNPSKTQDFNRYCYAFGNPLAYTDPDGNNPLFLIMAAGFALMQADIAGEQAQVNGQNYWSGFGRSVTNSAFSMIIGGAFGQIGSFISPGPGLIPGGIAGTIGGGLSGGFSNIVGGGDFFQGVLSGGINGLIMGSIQGYIDMPGESIKEEVSKDYIIPGNNGTLEDVCRESQAFYTEKIEITIDPPSDAEVDPKSNFFKYKDGSFSKGELVPNRFTGSYTAHISPAITRNKMMIREVLGHEIIHAKHYMLKLDKSTDKDIKENFHIYTENAAHSWSKRILSVYSGAFPRTVFLQAHYNNAVDLLSNKYNLSNTLFDVSPYDGL